MKRYLVEVEVEIPDEEYQTWSSSCDETFGVLNKLPDEVAQKATKISGPFKKVHDKILTEEGGI